MDAASRPELNLQPGWMNAAGALGFAPAAETLLPQAPLAFVTHPVSYAPRQPAADRVCAPFPGGFLLHTGWPNPGFRRVLKQYALRWARSETPVWVHLLADQPHEVDRMVRALEEREGVTAIEISLPPHAGEDLLLRLVAAALGELPLVVCIPLDQVQAAWVGQAVEQGVSGLVVSAPRGIVPRPNGGSIRGRLFGPGLFPQAAHALGCLRGHDLPVIAGCGVPGRAAMEALIAAGAAAVQFDFALWRGWEGEIAG